MDNKIFLEALLKEVNEVSVVHEAPALVKNPLDKNNNKTGVPNPDDGDTNDSKAGDTNNTDNNNQNDNTGNDGTATTDDTAGDVPEPVKNLQMAGDDSFNHFLNLFKVLRDAGHLREIHLNPIR